MAIVYVWSGAAGAGTGVDWTNAFTTLQAGCTAATAGTDIIYVADDHQETVGASTTLTTGGLYSSDVQTIVSVDRGTDAYSPAGAYQYYDPGILTIQGAAHWYGMYMKGTSRINMSHAYSDHKWFDCTLELTTTGSYFQIGYVSQWHYFENCAFIFSTTGTGSYLYGQFGNWTMVNCTFTGKVTANGVCYGYQAQTEIFEFIGCDFSALDTATNNAALAHRADTYPACLNAKFVNCKLPTDLGTIHSHKTYPRDDVLVVGCTTGSGDLFEHSRWSSYGQVLTTTSVYNDSGYVDQFGSKLSHKFSTGSAVDFNTPVVGLPIQVLITSTGSKTLTIELASDYASLTDKDFWVDIYAVDTASDVEAGLYTTYPVLSGNIKDPLDAGTALTSSAASWTGGGSLSKYKLSKTITFNRTGYFVVVPRLAKYEASKNVYLDPYVTVS